ncbi:tryptophan synthase alpha chain [Sphaerochaeta pleomorpha str. Grapes]|uniref:tryptophan synthase n=1 Tax=Sphaerochaeta pleomorpha (strain ATCC BAA-1885 / DSM 22778 / Grapes) TaxID=158190 RepID=G8QQL9_SPHPG|nr:tryptophan synthase subunit alpha [Sphaerochaeta pleomorpha]AEV30949.1 tryptophan synthase alpha chain [Sphaerochaeta pleomorpha str. Grapes]
MPKIYSERTKTVVSSGKKFIIGYFLAGYPDEEDFFNVLEIVEKNAVDICEIGFPSKNPYADGQVIADIHAKVDFDTAIDIAYWKRIRESTGKPIWVMAYYEDFVATGIYRSFAEEGVFDAMVIPNTDFATRRELQKEMAPFGIDVVGFASPAMAENELAKVLESSSLVYEQLYVGQTGIAQSDEMYHPMLEYTKQYPQVICFAGFGINSYEKVNKVFQDGFHGAAIGTELVKRINISMNSLEKFLRELERAH